MLEITNRLAVLEPAMAFARQNLTQWRTTKRSGPSWIHLEELIRAVFTILDGNGVETGFQITYDNTEEARESKVSNVGPIVFRLANLLPDHLRPNRPAQIGRLYRKIRPGLLASKTQATSS